MTGAPIPVFRPQLMGQNGKLQHFGTLPINHLMQTLESGWWGTGPKVSAFEAEFARFLDVDATRCLMLNSCTAALHLAAKLYPDAERFLVPALTFVSTALAPRYEGKEIRFVDVGDDLCIDQDDALNKLEVETDVVIAVHLGGQVAALDRLRDRCRVIEDCAHALGSYEWRRAAEGVAAGYHVGTEGVGCFSFQSTKGLPVGDGGMLVLSHEVQRARAEAWAWCGIEQGTWERATDDYRWAYSIEGVGYKYRANDIMAALALDQWPGLASTLAERARIAARYTEALNDLSWLRLPCPREDTRPNWQEYMVGTIYRDALQDHLAKRGVSTTVHYYPIHYYPIWGGRRQRLPITRQIWRQILTIPCYAGMTGEEQERVVDGIRSFSL